MQPRETTLTIASPSIVRTHEAGEWLRAHGEASPITRHALFVLESLDAIDPAYDTFAVAMLDGEVDTSGYPEYASIVGGVAAHWDESTGDLIVRGVVGLGRPRRPRRHGPQRDPAARPDPRQHPRERRLARPGAHRAPGDGRRPSVACQHCGYPLVHPASGLLPEVRHA